MVGNWRANGLALRRLVAYSWSSLDSSIAAASDLLALIFVVLIAVLVHGWSYLCNWLFCFRCRFFLRRLQLFVDFWQLLLRAFFGGANSIIEWPTGQPAAKPVSYRWRLLFELFGKIEAMSPWWICSFYSIMKGFCSSKSRAEQDWAGASSSLSFYSSLASSYLSSSSGDHAKSSSYFDRWWFLFSLKRLSPFFSAFADRLPDSKNSWRAANKRVGFAEAEPFALPIWATEAWS